jgi:hypothetical protein
MSLFSILMLSGGVITAPWDTSNYYTATHSTYTGTNKEQITSHAADSSLSWVALTATDLLQTDTTNYGVVHLFRKSAGVLISSGTITRPVSNLVDAFFGSNIQMSADGTKLICSSDESTNGALYVYTRSGTTWTLVQTITHPTSATGTYFAGMQLSSNGNVLVARNIPATGTNCLFRYTWNGSQFVFHSSFAPKLAGSTSISAISSDGLFISVCEQATAGAQSSLRFYRFNGTAFVSVGTFADPGGTFSTSFGISSVFTNAGNTFYVEGASNQIYRLTWNGTTFVLNTSFAGYSLDTLAVNEADNTLVTQGSTGSTEIYVKPASTFSLSKTLPAYTLFDKFLLNESGAELALPILYRGFGGNYHWRGEIGVYRK